ncbi:hypothetical protein QLQ12_32920 [Actinoplanes sp. NEAU-A12]|uniref:PadR family transcriptional regulator n=1 Tax=Actinoplanes sandaracinus TaxID=3045177 RepID=A0ABT6WUJ9_9ACTN|nr:hypothetical protein [Actinoplanes sandaracinus]MDI6103422.1 hypothetical protein [Actinoplanes sandaracinus]
MAADLSTPARQALIALMVSVERASNPDLRRNYRVEVTKGAREELEREKLISWEKGPRGAIFYELTDKGWRRARQEFRSAPPERVTGPWLLHYATLRHLDSLMERADYKIADVFAGPDPGPATAAGAAGEPSVEDRVRAAYLDLARTPGDWIRLVAIRARLTDVARSEQDRVLTEMDRRREIHLDPDPARNELPQDALDAAILIGGEAKHLITIGRA